MCLAQTDYSIPRKLPVVELPDNVVEAEERRGARAAVQPEQHGRVDAAGLGHAEHEVRVRLGRGVDGEEAAVELGRVVAGQLDARGVLRAEVVALLEQVLQSVILLEHSEHTPLSERPGCLTLSGGPELRHRVLSRVN